MTDQERRAASLALAEKIHDAMQGVDPEAIAFCLVTLLESAPPRIMKLMREMAGARALMQALLTASVTCECAERKAKRGQA